MKNLKLNLAAFKAKLSEEKEEQDIENLTSEILGTCHDDPVDVGPHPCTKSSNPFGCPIC